MIAIAFKNNDYKKLELKLKKLIKELLTGQKQFNTYSYTIDFQPVESYAQKYNGKFYGLTEIEVIQTLKADNYYKFSIYFRFNQKELYKVLRVHKINNKYQYELN